MMTLMDDGVGDLMSLLRELDLDDQTLVMLSSDNGPHKEGGHDPQFFNSNGPFRGHKRDLYEGGVRVPLIARWPHVIKRGSSSNHVSAHWDMLPTFCELGEVEIPSDIDGISLVPTLTGRGQQRSHEYLYWEFYERGGKRAVRFNRWKAVQLNLKRTNQQDGIELYDLSKDAGEQTNVASQHPHIVRQASKYFAAAHTPSEFWKFGPRRKRRATPGRSDL
jgi:arylsulfatase A-like enzyme